MESEKSIAALAAAPRRGSALPLACVDKRLPLTDAVAGGGDTTADGGMERMEGGVTIHQDPAGRLPLVGFLSDFYIWL